MRLIKIEEQGKLRLIDHNDDNNIPLPHYAILSHKWGRSDEEITIEDLRAGKNEGKPGWEKIAFCNRQAVTDSIQHFWVDTCCIDRANLTELNEAINSMFRWYQRATKCYVYLADVSVNGNAKAYSPANTGCGGVFSKSEWFLRGWTLQELIAPKTVEFFSKEGEFLGSKQSLELQIHEISGVALEALRGRSMAEYSVDERFSWAASRKTTREEDMVYSMLGMFHIYMPLIYGEGRENAEKRLRREIGTLGESLLTEEDRCLQSLYPSGIAYYEQKNQNPDRVPNTCLWALENPKYLDWRDQDTRRLLWISADPGYGKSVLAKCILDEDLPGAFRNDSSKRAFYYFFKDTSPEQRSACRAICTILYQLFSVYPRLIQHALLRFKKSGAALSTTLSELCAIFREAVIDPIAGDVVCVLDALDECNEHEQSEIFGLLEGLCLQQQRSSSVPHVKFLITSRPYFNIRQGFDSLLEESYNIELAGKDESESIKEEIDLVIQHQVKALKQELRLKGEVSDHLKRRLLATEHRTYLWLHLLWKIIRKNPYQPGNKSGLNKLIDNLPADIQTLYELLLQKSPDPEFANKVLQIVLVAARPLTVTEMDVAVNLKDYATSYADLEEELEGPQRIEETLSSRCGMMISVIQSKVYFIHQTVKEFLLQRTSIGYQTGQKWQDSMYLIKSHHLMFKICIQNICFRDVLLDQAEVFGALLPVHERQLEANNFCHAHPFLSYSAIYWADHFLQGGDDHDIQIVKNLLETGRHQSVKGRYSQDCGGQLHAASAGGHLIIVRLILDTGANVNAEGRHFGNALQAASEGGHEAVVRLLLNRGADVNARGGWYVTALHVASERGHEAVVQLLLDRGADVNAQSGGHYKNALQAASGRGQKAVVQLLLDRGAIFST